jgi:hypothetical protein
VPSKTASNAVRLNCWSTSTRLHDCYRAHGFERDRTCGAAGHMSEALFQRRITGEEGVSDKQ